MICSVEENIYLCACTYFPKRKFYEMSIEKCIFVQVGRAISQIFYVRVYFVHDECSILDENVNRRFLYDSNHRIVWVYIVFDF